MKRRAFTTAALLLTALGSTSLVSAATLDFQLLTWTSADATTELPSAEGLKPSAPTSAGDWLVFTGDDQVLPAIGYNDAGALSHNLADLAGTDGAQYNMAPSLTGSLTLQLNQTDPGHWQVSVTDLAYAGQAMGTITMNQFLIKAGDPATLNDAFNVDGLGNSGTWDESAAGNWAIQYDLDFYFDVSLFPADSINATFNDKPQAGHLIPVEYLTVDGLAGLTAGIDGYYTGDLWQYILDEIAPRLPDDATYLLLTQMDKTHPDYAGPGVPITTAATIGNFTIAYSTQSLTEDVTPAVPEPATFTFVSIGLLGLGCLRRRRAQAH